MAKEKKTSKERVRLAVLLGTLLAVVVAGVWYLGGGGLGGDSGKPGEIDYVAHDLPPLEIDGIGREGGQTAESAGNPFTFRPPPTPTKNLTPSPTPVPRPTMPPRPTRKPRQAVGSDGNPKPPPPPFDREFIGYLGPALDPVAAFRRGGSESDSSEIDIAMVGDVLDDIYIVREIGLESVLIGFVGYAPSEDTRVPLSEK
jgi:hypothetical protein